ncbi:helix-turn-helix domain-containing protein [Streptomyces sp. NPDC003011]
MGRPTREYQRLLRRYREMRTRKEIGLPPLSRRRGGPRPQGLRQVDVDLKLNGGAGTYQRVESGTFRPTQDLFLEIADVLKLSSPHLRIAHLDLYRSEPVLPVEKPSPRWSQVLDGQHEMACALTPDGRLVASNHAFSQMFAHGGPPTNLWRWALWSEDAQDVLLDWDKRWVPHLITELKLAHYRYPRDKTVRKLFTALIRDPRLHHVTESLVGLEDEAFPLRHPTQGPGTARFMAAHTPGGLGIWTVLFETDT